MSFWDTPQTGFGLAPEQVAVGPKLGILGAFERAYKETTQLNSQYGAEMMLRDLEQANRKKIFDAGLVPPPSLEPEEGDTVPKDRIQNPFAHFSTSYYTDYMRTGSAGDRDDKLRKLRAERPDLGIQTYDEMRTKMQEDAQQRRKEAAFPQTYPGAVAGFAGGLVGAFDPRYNPLNVATLGVGGFGESVADKTCDGSRRARCAASRATRRRSIYGRSGKPEVSRHTRSDVRRARFKRGGGSGRRRAIPCRRRGDRRGRAWR
jgi:hypothetical protein